MTIVATDFAALRVAAADLLARRTPEHLARLRWTPEELAAHQTRSVRGMLAHAIAHSPFHRDRLEGLDPGGFEIADLATLPVMTKAEMMADFDRVVTEPGLDRTTVEAALAGAGTDPVPLPGGHFAMASGGSSGVRGVFVYSLEALVEYALSMVRSSLARLEAFGGPPPGGVQAAFVTAGSAVHATRLVPGLLSGEVICTTPVPATLPLTEIVERLNALQPMMLQSYPSILAALVAEQQAGRLRISPLAIVGTSEPFEESTREAVADTFGVAPTDQFGSSEGLTGVSDPGSGLINLAADLALVELVDASGRPVPPGTPSAKVYVTTLFNSAMPLIRYELTDRMVEHGRSSAGFPQVTVEGRSDDVLRWGELTVHPLAIRSVLVRTPEVTEYQVRQTPTGVDIDVVLTAPCDTGVLATSVRAALRAGGLSEAEVTVRAVDTVERHEFSGKVRRFVPLRV